MLVNTIHNTFFIKVSGRNPFDRTRIINLAEFIFTTYFLWIRVVNEMIDEWSGSLDSTLFPRKQWNRLHGRSSDLFLLWTPSRKTYPVAHEFGCSQHNIWNLQQRDCPGFTPDSLLIVSLAWELRTNVGQR